MGLSGNDGKITNPTLIFIVMLCELQPKITAMESSIRGVSIFWKLS